MEYLQCATCVSFFLHPRFIYTHLHFVKNDFKNGKGIFLECDDRVIGTVDTESAAVKEFRCYYPATRRGFSRV